MEPNKIVVHFKDGSILKGTTNDLFQNKKSFHLNQANGRVEEVQLEKLKSVFFVKDHKGDDNYFYKYDDTVVGGGRKIVVEFQDGETIIGYVLSYSRQRQAFLMTPGDLGGNNERILVVTSATQSVSFMPNDHALPTATKPLKLKNLDARPAKNRRKSERVVSFNLLSYVCFDADQKPLEQGMGKTLDIGLGGLMMETNVPIDAEYILLMSTNFTEELIKIRGEVVFCRESESKTFHTGIRFLEKSEKIRKIVSDMLAFYIATKAA
jgi:hypothetical protein